MTQSTSGYTPTYSIQQLGNGPDPAYSAAQGDTTTIVTPGGTTAPTIQNYAQGAQGGTAPIVPGANTTGSEEANNPGTIFDPFGFGFNQTGNPTSGNGYVPGGAYDTAVNTAVNQAAGYNQAAQNVVNNPAAQVNNPYARLTQQQLSGINSGQANLIGQLQATAANGQNSQAYRQYQQSVANGLTAQTAIANSAGGGALGAAGARRAAQSANANTSIGSQAGGALVAQQAQQAAQGTEAQVLGQQAGLTNAAYGQNAALGTSNAQLMQQQQGINNAGVLGYNSLTQGEQGSQLNALEGASNALLGAEGLGQYQQGVNNQQTATYVGAGTGAGAAGASVAGQALGSYAQQNQPSSGPTEAQLENPYS